MWRRRREASGFSLVEMLVSIAIALTVTTAVLSVTSPLQGAMQSEAERADMQQRLRVSVDTLSRDLLMAGNGSSVGTNRGPLTAFFAPVLPFRQGLRQGDPPGTVASDTITVLFAPQTIAQATIGQPIPAQSGDVTVVSGPGCGAGVAACGFAAGMDVLIYDDSGFFDLYTISGVSAPTLHVQHDLRDAPHTYAAGSKIVQITSRTYYLKIDDVTETYQLMQYDDGSGDDMPVVDHVVALQFEYYGDPQPPVLQRPLSDPIGPWTSYGPKPPPSGVKPTNYPAGENCAFALNGAGEPSPRLAVLDGGAGLTRLDRSILNDGPWCPDALHPNRFDADLLRVRQIAVTLRVESALDALRGPAGLLFSHRGLGRVGSRLLPDAEIRFEVSPRNLNLGR